jgi:hypothetical protein
MTESFYWTEYTILHHVTLTELKIEMQAYLNKGFEPFGSLVVANGVFCREVAKKKFTKI